MYIFFFFMRILVFSCIFRQFISYKYYFQAYITILNKFANIRLISVINIHLLIIYIMVGANKIKKTSASILQTISSRHDLCRCLQGGGEAVKIPQGEYWCVFLFLQITLFGTAKIYTSKVSHNSPGANRLKSEHGHFSIFKKWEFLYFQLLQLYRFRENSNRNPL